MQARFQRGHLEAVTGVLSSGQGVISRSLLTAAIDRLGLVRGNEPSTPGEFVPYDQMNVAFLLNPQGLQVQGRCQAGGTGAILADRYGPLLCDPKIQPIQWSVVSEEWSVLLSTPYALLSTPFVPYFSHCPLPTPHCPLIKGTRFARIATHGLGFTFIPDGSAVCGQYRAFAGAFVGGCWSRCDSAAAATIAG